MVSKHLIVSEYFRNWDVFAVKVMQDNKWYVTHHNFNWSCHFVHSFQISGIHSHEGDQMCHDWLIRDWENDLISIIQHNGHLYDALHDNLEVVICFYDNYAFEHCNKLRIF